MPGLVASAASWNAARRELHAEIVGSDEAGEPVRLLQCRHLPEVSEYT